MDLKIDNLENYIITNKSSLTTDMKHFYCYPKERNKSKNEIKACKNCSCHEKEASKEISHEHSDTKSNRVLETNCGNCYRGDPFRCSRCPYKGSPGLSL